MSIILPDFKDRKCLDASVCGFMSIAEYPQKDKLPTVEKSLVAEYEKSGRKVFMRLVLPFPGDDDNEMHVHVDLSAGERWKKKPPKVNSTTDDILAKLAPLIGKKMNVTLRGRFRVALAELPSFIRVMLGESNVNNVKVRMSEGTLTVRGAPIHEIGWVILDEDAGANISLVARTEMNLEESYLVKELDLLESAFKAFIVGENSND
jgi:hypothetical protein